MERYQGADLVGVNAAAGPGPSDHASAGEAPPDSVADRRVVVAMSGGVDSSIAAALLLEQGYRVSGVRMRLWSEEGVNGGTGDPEWSLRAADDARRVCDALGIPLRVVDYRAPFREQVVEYFVAEYSQGRTPNPCLACNRYIKFGLLLDEAVAHEADFLATGHYARVRRSNGSYQLLRGLDRSKDQSYFLYMLGQRHLRRLLLPLGDYSKQQVRAMARERGLSTGGAAESQDLCFVPEGDYRRVLGRLIPESVLPGPIVDSGGKVLGQHRGLPFYTVGQRKGLGVSAPEALYVVALNVPNNALVVGPSSELGRTALLAKEVVFVSGCFPAAPLLVEAKIRYRARLRRATLEPLSEQRARVSFEQPLRDITPGQAVVFYDGDVVLGGGIICDQPADR